MWNGGTLLGPSLENTVCHSMGVGKSNKLIKEVRINKLEVPPEE